MEYKEVIHTISKIMYHFNLFLVFTIIGNFKSWWKLVYLKMFLYFDVIVKFCSFLLLFSMYRWIYTVAVLVRFLFIRKYGMFFFVSIRFCTFFVYKKVRYVLVRQHFYMTISALTRLSNAGQKFSQKKFCKRVQPDFEISLSLLHVKFL